MKLAMSVSALAATMISFAAPKRALSVGDAAPAISVNSWVKGHPVTEFKPGKIYLVDFFATWCPPCNHSMPHLSELAKTYKDKIVVMGVDVRENDEGAHVDPGKQMDAKVAAFAKAKGDDMAYNVCTDDLQGSMMANWMTASSEHGIPCVFVIDQNGHVADIVLGYGGQKDNRLDTAISQLLAGTFDYKAALAQHTAEITPGK